LPPEEKAGPIYSAGMVLVDWQAWPIADLRVDRHDTPLAELAGLWELWKPQMQDYVTARDQSIRSARLRRARRFHTMRWLRGPIKEGALPDVFEALRIAEVVVFLLRFCPSRRQSNYSKRAMPAFRKEELRAIWGLAMWFLGIPRYSWLKRMIATSSGTFEMRVLKRRPRRPTRRHSVTVTSFQV